MRGIEKTPTNLIGLPAGIEGMGDRDRSFDDLDSRKDRGLLLLLAGIVVLSLVLGWLGIRKAESVSTAEQFGAGGAE